MSLTNVRSCMTRMPHKYTDGWEIEVAVVIVECMSRGFFQDSFTRQDLRNYYRLLQQHFHSDDKLEEKVSRALEGLINHGLLVMVNDNEYKTVTGELLDDIIELRKIEYSTRLR